jgi:hypothetical protein
MNAPAHEDESNQPTDLLACQIITYEPDPDGRLHIVSTDGRLGDMIIEGQVVICNLSMAWLAEDESPDQSAWTNLSLTIGRLRKLGARVIINMTHYMAPFHAKVFAKIPDVFAMHGRDPDEAANMRIFWVDTDARNLLRLETDAPALTLLNNGHVVGTSDHDKPYDLTPLLDHFQEPAAA